MSPKSLILLSNTCADTCVDTVQSTSLIVLMCTSKRGVVCEYDDGKLSNERWIRHAEIVDLVERKFEGGTAICFADCCHAGGFGEAVIAAIERRRRRDRGGTGEGSKSDGALRVKYACVMSVPPADTAGME